MLPVTEFVDPTSGDAPATDAPVVDAQVLESTEVNEVVLLKLLRRAGRTLARPALECLELLLDPRPLHQPNSLCWLRLPTCWCP